MWLRGLVLGVSLLLAPVVVQAQEDAEGVGAPGEASPPAKVVEEPAPLDDGQPMSVPTEGPSGQAEPSEQAGPARPVTTWTGARPEHLRFRPALRGGRYTSYASFGALAVGAVLVPVGAGLGVYDFRGDWFDKWKYDEAYLKRSEAQTPVMIVGAAAASLHLPLLFSGVLLEGHALRRMAHHNTSIGWVGLGMFVGGGAMLTAGIFTGVPPLLIMGGSGVVGGWACGFAQLARNMRTAKHLPDAAFDDLYRPKKRVQVTVAPWWHDGPELTVLGRF